MNARWPLASAAAGFLGWTALGTAVHLRWTTLGMDYGLMLNVTGILLFGVLVTTPVCLALVAPREGEASSTLPWRGAVSLQPVAAALVFVAFSRPAGLPAAALAVPWLVMAGLMALHGLARFARHWFSRPEELAIDAGLVYIPVGAAWLAASRAGVQPMGFQEPIVLLTATHFHFAGLAAPVLAGLAGRRLAEWGRPTWLPWCAAAAGTIAGVPMLAAGITFSPALELAAAFVLAGSLDLLALLTLFVIVPRLEGRGARVLLVLSSGSVLASMTFAVRYAWGEYRGVVIHSIPRMATIHGLLNAIGFVGCGLLAWLLVERRRRA